MNNSRGNISVALLIIGLFLAAVTHLAMVYVHRDVSLEQDYLRGRQLRMLCSSLMSKVAGQELEAGEGLLLEANLEPGKVPVRVTTKVTFSDDGMFRAVKVKAVADELSQSLRHVSFMLDEDKRAQAKQFMFVSGKELLGSEFISSETIYTSAEEVRFPQIEFLKNTGDVKRSIAALGMEDVRLYGLDNRFYYLNNATTPLTFTKNLKVYGTAVIATEGSLIIEEGCQFLDRIIFLSNGNITIKNNVELPQVLLLAYGKVSIGAGCKLGGVVFSGSNIELLGASEFTHDENVVAPFSSAFYLQ